MAPAIPRRLKDTGKEITNPREKVGHFAVDIVSHKDALLTWYEQIRNQLGRNQ